jgi:hypothetical protein
MSYIVSPQGKTVEQYERDRHFTCNIDTEEADKLMIKRCNKDNAGVIKQKNIMDISLEIYLRNRNVHKISKH